MSDELAERRAALEQAEDRLAAGDVIVRKMRRSGQRRQARILSAQSRQLHRRVELLRDDLARREGSRG